MSHPSFNSTSAPNVPTLAPNGTVAVPVIADWQADSLRRMVLSERKVVKLDRVAFLQLLALRDTPEQVVADLVAMFTETGE